MQYSWLPQQPRQPVQRVLPPVVITQQRYSRILANAYQTAKQQQQRQRLERQRVNEQLRLGGEQLLLRFTDPKPSSTPSYPPKLPDTNAQEKPAQSSDEQRKREERIAKAQLLLEQLRPGPRELQCAQLQSEVLRAVNVQRQLQADFKSATQQQRQLDQRIYGEQVLNELQAAQQRHAERRSQLNEYKGELLRTIEMRRQERASTAAAEVLKGREERERHERAVKEQQLQEQNKQLEKQRERRQQALAALQITQQRLQRLRMLEEVEERQCEVHNEAKTQLEQLKHNQAKQRVRQRLQQNEQLAKQQAPRLHYSASEDNARQERQLVAMRQSFSAEQREERQRRQQAVTTRLQTQQQEQAAAAAAQQQAAEQRQAEQAQRLENAQLYIDYKQAEYLKRLDSMRKLRQQLDQQLRERAAAEALPETNYNRLAQLECLRQDSFFFDYAQQLMSEASAKGCPLKPFVRAVAQYKQENRIAAAVRVPRHLVSRLTMGLRTEGDSPALAKAQGEQQQRPTSASSLQQEQQLRQGILDNLKKIEALMLEEKQQRPEAAKSSQLS